MSKQTERFSLKDHLFNLDRVQYLAGLFSASDPNFKTASFQKDVMRSLGELELKQRIVHIAECLETYLDNDFAIAAKQIVAALPPPLDPNLRDDDFGDFIMAPLGEFVVRNGMAKRHVGRSLRTLKEITKRFSMEDAIRHFIREHPEKTMRELSKWVTDKNYHVRRLVSEGTRPSLPWSGRIGLSAEQTLPLLDQLYADPTRYVTRSVANHLNDISKSDSKLVVKTLRSWKSEGRQSESELSWVTRHALRTLIKQGDEGALKFLGFRSNPKVEVLDFKQSHRELKPGETLSFEFDIQAARAERLIVDYVIEFVKANGSTAPKVFKLSQVELSKGEVKALRKNHPFRANATTFTLYPGEHTLSIQLNGKIFASTTFHMLA